MEKEEAKISSKASNEENHRYGRSTNDIKRNRVKNTMKKTLKYVAETEQ